MKWSGGVDMTFEKKLRLRYRLVSATLLLGGGAISSIPGHILSDTFVFFLIASVFLFAVSFSKYTPRAIPPNGSLESSSLKLDDTAANYEVMSQISPFDYSNPVAVSKMDSNGYH